MGYGVYLIINTRTNDVYVGLTRTSFQHRWQNHQKELRANTHRNNRLQKAWNKYGSQAFEFVPIEEAGTYTQAEEAENFYLTYFKFIGVSLYNHKMPPYHHGGQIPGKESRLKMRHSHLGRGQTPEARAKISATMRGRMPQAAYAANTREWSALISPDGEIFVSIVNLSQFCRTHHLDTGTMSRLMRGMLTQHRGWRIYVEGEDYKNIPNPRAKAWGSFISPDGVVYRDVINLNAFCKTHRLSQPAMRRLASGTTREHRGWRRFTGGTDDGVA